MTWWNEILRRSARITAGPLVARAMVFVTAWVGLLLAMPAAATSAQTLLGAAVLAALPAIGPGTWAVTAVLLATIGTWLLDTVGFAAPVTAGRLFSLACALYLTHAAAALAAVLPYDAIVDNQVLMRWAIRAVLVLAVAGLVTLVLVNVVSGVTASAPTIALLVGLAVVGALVALLARMARMARRG